MHRIEDVRVDGEDEHGDLDGTETSLHPTSVCVRANEGSDR